MAKAFGKLILLGEHAVVYGVPALACGIDRGLEAELGPASGDQHELVLLAERRTTRDDDPLARAYTALLEAGSGMPATPVMVRVYGTLPPGMNLGFSAAAAVAIARALEERGASARGDAGADLEGAVRARADAWERVFHGNPSGIDVAAAQHGGFVHFRKGESPRTVVPRHGLRLCVGLSGVKPGPTRAMVDGVARLRQRRPDAFQKTLDAIGALVDRAETALLDGDASTFGALMGQNHLLLVGWMLSTEPLEELCAMAYRHGALGAKLTGAGGGGAMVALAGVADEPSSAAVAAGILAAWRDAGREGFEVVVGPRRD